MPRVICHVLYATCCMTRIVLTAPRVLCHVLCYLHLAPCTLQPLAITPGILYRASCTMHPAPSLPHPAPRTLHNVSRHPAPCTLPHATRTLHSAPCTPPTPHSSPCTLHPALFTLHSILCGLHSAPYTLNPHPAICTPQPAPRTPHPARHLTSGIAHHTTITLFPSAAITHRHLVLYLSRQSSSINRGMKDADAARGTGRVRAHECPIILHPPPSLRGNSLPSVAPVLRPQPTSCCSRVVHVADICTRRSSRTDTRGAFMCIIAQWTVQILSSTQCHMTK
jgi:hypothetical protein